jgi:crotonobetaine/carnitine-CoA ligase
VPSTIPELLHEAVAAVPSKVWLHTDDRTFTFSEAHTLVERAASAMAEMGVRPGDLVLSTARNTPEYLFAWLGATSSGAIIVAVNPLAGEDELVGLIRQVRPRLVVTDPGAPATVRGAGGPTVDVAELYTRPAGTPATHRPEPDDAAALIPTSGTTGRSKLVTQTHRAYTMAGEGFPWWMELGPDDRLMTSLPLFHVNAPAYSVMGSLAARAGLVLLPRFSASTFLDSARRHGATEFNAIGAMLEILMRLPVHASDADTPLRLCYTGPSPPKTRQLEMEERFGLRIVCGYALSETPYGMIWPHGSRPYGTLGTVRQHPRLGTVNEARVVVD